MCSPPLRRTGEALCAFKRPPYVGGNRLLRKLKGALGIGSIWGAAFAGVGAVLGAVIPTTSFLSTVVGLGGIAGLGGLLLGVGFAGLLSAMEGRRSLVELTSRRAALWGFLAGSALALAGSVVLGSVLDVVSVAETLLGLEIPVALQVTALVAGSVSYGTIAAGLASATVSLAKRAHPPLPSDPDEPTRLFGSDVRDRMGPRTP